MKGRVLLSAALACVLPGVARADVILSAERLNAALKTMQRLHHEIGNGPARTRAEAVFRLGAEGDALAALLSDEVAAHGMQEKALIDLALLRAGEIGIAIAYNTEKKKFFYDGAAFRQYLKDAPRGPRAAEAAFWLVESEFYQSTPSDPASLLAAADRKKAFLRRYPTFTLVAEVELFLAVDYRDLYRHYQAAGDAGNRDRFRELARAQLRRVVRRFRGAEQAKIAEEMQRRFEAEVRTRGGGP